MGIPLAIFSLHRLRSERAGCLHHLLLRVEQPAFSNADAGEYDHAVEVAEGKRRALIRAYEERLAGACAAPHEVSLVGELQSWPAGDELIDGRGGCDVDVWVAETRYGHPWVVMGTAESEEAFWREVEADDDLAGLGPVRPAVRHRAFFLAEEDDERRG
ncbi:MAG TPA: hypothetical protein VF746_09915 [Longimicrobium sp.]|jgi:hypothetical protein